ncbi:extracellular solute-binding protein [Nocardioides sp. NPDC023903]|uniref:extracellular solute-binding protein n=1 Tax=Nocardioides sp. NPDC023903 TaxID=3157195 RepID=UPI0033CD9575
MSDRRRNLSRRGSALLTLVSLSTVVLSGCGSGASGDEGQESADLAQANLTFADYGGDLSEAMNSSWLEPFSEETGAKFTQDPSMDPAKIRIQVETGNVEWDLAEVDTWLANQQCGKQFEELNPGTLDASKFSDGYVTNKCGVPVLGWGAVLAYDKSKFGDDPPTSWADFFDTKKYPGKRCAPASSPPGQFNMEAGLLADGVAPDELYPLDVDRAIERWRPIADDTAFLESSTQQVDTMISGGAAMCIAYSSRVYDAVKGGANWQAVWPTVIRNWDNIVVLKGSASNEDAKAFLDWMSDHPEAQDQLAEQVAFASTADDSTGRGDPLLAEYLVSNHRDEGTSIDFDWYADGVDAASMKWQEAFVG